MQRIKVQSAYDAANSGAVLGHSSAAAEERRFTGREDTSGAAARYAAPKSHPEYITLHYATG